MSISERFADTEWGRFSPLGCVPDTRRFRLQRFGRRLRIIRAFMKKKRLTRDQQPGAIPEIQKRNGSITYAFAPASPVEQARLTIRYDADGNLWAALADTRLFLD